jgi:hypothetical protein
MKGKASTKKVSDKSKEKGKAKETKKASVFPETAATNKKEIKRVKSKVVKVKKKVKAEAEKKSAKTRIKGKEKEKPKKLAAGRKKKAKKIEREAPLKGKKKAPLKLAVRGGKAGSRGVRVEKIPKKVTKKIKQATSREEEIEGKRYPKIKQRIRTTKITRGPGIVEVSGLRIKEKPRRGEKKKEVKAGIIPEKPGQKGEAPGEKKGKEKTRPLSEEKYPQLPRKILPEGYGENDIKLMTVDPYKLFVFWEVREDTSKMFTGDINIRIHDVTGTGSLSENSYFDIKVNERIGKRYIDVGPDRVFVADIGIIHEGIFISIVRSHEVSTPRASVSEQGVWPQEIYETRSGY